MQSSSGLKTMNGSASAFQTAASPDAVLINNHLKRLKIKEFISWSVCFVIITLITGLLKFLKIGVTMDSVTSGLFYLSLGGLTWLIYKIFKLSKNQPPTNKMPKHGMN
jgi:hypothetical protein